ncbi:hypothetical protein F5876DRAFT_31026, partial [Lentinula aff. lateritia]
IELTWSPQEIILSHPATRWFIIHGDGTAFRRSSIEFRCKYAFFEDQPYNATLIIRNHQATFEHISVGTGDRRVRLPYEFKDAMTLPSFTPKSAKEKFRALLKKTKGRKFRRNSLTLAEKMRKAWTEGSPAKVDFEALLRKYGMRNQNVKIGV